VNKREVLIEALHIAWGVLYDAADNIDQQDLSDEDYEEVVACVKDLADKVWVRVRRLEER
jgi:hypothetical protein